MMLEYTNPICRRYPQGGGYAAVRFARKPA